MNGKFLAAATRSVAGAFASSGKNARRESAIRLRAAPSLGSAFSISAIGMGSATVSVFRAVAPWVAICVCFTATALSATLSSAIPFR
ncbi:MAG: hypothetical protein IPP63_12525 [Chloracidobacterium sp.]|nr:hypothetical protein [Chloracidobacterium sp.]